MPWELVENASEESGGFKKFVQGTQRNLARTGARVVEQGLGLPGDILDTLVGAGQWGHEKLGMSSPEQEKGIAQVRKYIPTTEKIRKLHEPYTDEYLQPQNKVEAFADDVVQDATALLSPSGRAKLAEKYSAKLFKKLAISTGANLAGEGIEQVTGSKEAGTYSKIGSLFILSLIDKRSASKQIGDLYQKAEANLPQGATGNSIKLDKNLSNLKTTVTKGRPPENLAPSEKFVLDEIQKFERLSQEGKIPIEQLVAQKRSLNEELTKLYQTIPGKKGQARARDLAKQINHFANDAIEDYGKTNPQFMIPYREANQAFGTMAQSNWIANWAEKNIKQTPMTSGLMHLFLGPTTTTMIGGIAFPYQGYKLAYRIGKSPTLAKIYGKTLKAAAKEDAVAFNKYLKELDNAIQEEEGKDQWEFIDQGSNIDSLESLGLSAVNEE
jgi:hypothetical protein